MKGLKRIFHPQALTLHDTITLSKETSHHLKNVLRAKRQDTVVVFNGEGGEFSGVITDIQRNHICLELLSFQTVNRESSKYLHLAQTLIKSDKLDFILQKSVELGINEITLLYSDYCDVKQFDEERLKKRLTHWQSIIIQACQQSGRTMLPKLNPPVALKDWCCPQNTKIALHPGVEKSLRECKTNLNEAALIIGPEGGFSDPEVIALQKQDFQCYHLGPRLLRAETAAIAGLSLLQF